MLSGRQGIGQKWAQKAFLHTAWHTSCNLHPQKILYYVMLQWTPPSHKWPPENPEAKLKFQNFQNFQNLTLLYVALSFFQIKSPFPLLFIKTQSPLSGLVPSNSRTLPWTLTGSFRIELRWGLVLEYKSLFDLEELLAAPCHLCTRDLNHVNCSPSV